MRMALVSLELVYMDGHSRSSRAVRDMVSSSFSFATSTVKLSLSA